MVSRMPNRILRETVCTSNSVDQLSWFEEVLFYRLIVNCDDFGRYDGRAAIIKNRLFPLKENLTLKTVENALHGLASAGLVALYYREDKRFLCLPTWGKYQNQRAKASKYPAPEECDTMQPASTCMQMHADVPVFEIRESRYENRDTGCENRRDAPAPAHEKSKKNTAARHEYGAYRNVLLSDEDLLKLREEFPDWEARIERLSEYIASSGKSYKNHLATIRAWARKDAEPQGKPAQRPGKRWQTAEEYDRNAPGDLEKAAVRRMMGDG